MIYKGSHARGTELKRRVYEAVTDFTGGNESVYFCKDDIMILMGMKPSDFVSNVSIVLRSMRKENLLDIVYETRYRDHPLIVYSLNKNGRDFLGIKEKK